MTSGDVTPRVTLLCAPAPMGGLESSVAILAKGLARAGTAVQLVQLLTQNGRSPAAFDGLEGSGVRLETVRCGARAYLEEARAVRRCLRVHGSLVLHSHGERADLVSRLLGRAAPARLSTVHGFIVNSARARLAKRVHLRLLRAMERVIAVSDALAAELAPALGQRVVALPNAVAERALLSRPEARVRLGTPAESCLVGWVGRFSEEKRPLHFLDALEAVRAPVGVHAVLVGDGPLMSLVRERVHAAGLSERVHLPGLIPDAGALFPAFDLFVLSSSTEGTPMTLLEAMQAGVPVVATAVGGVPDVLRDDAGWLVPPGDVTAFARAMQEALLDAVARVRRSAAAQATVRSRFSEPSWIARHLQLYAEVTSSVPPNRPAPPLA